MAKNRSSTTVKKMEMPTYSTVFRAITGVFGSIRILRKLFSPLNPHTNAPSRSVKAMATVMMAGRMYSTVIKIRNGERNR